MSSVELQLKNINEILERLISLRKKNLSLYCKLKKDHFPDKELLQTNIGEKSMFEGKEVWLDIPMENTELLSEDDKFKGKKSGSPTRDTSGGKAYKVYVAGCSKKTDSNPRGIKLIRFGSGGLKAKLSNKQAKKSYNARHGCSEGRHNDKCKAGYWSCRLPWRIRHQRLPNAEYAFRKGRLTR